jgi:hypothetical protein
VCEGSMASAFNTHSFHTVWANAPGKDHTDNVAFQKDREAKELLGLICQAEIDWFDVAEKQSTPEDLVSDITTQSAEQCCPCHTTISLQGTYQCGGEAAASPTEAESTAGPTPAEPAGQGTLDRHLQKVQFPTALSCQWEVDPSGEWEVAVLSDSEDEVLAMRVAVEADEAVAQTPVHVAVSGVDPKAAEAEEEAEERQARDMASDDGAPWPVDGQASNDRAARNTQQLASEAVTLYRHEAWVLQSLLDERPGSPTILTQLDTDSNPTTTEPDIVPEPSPGQALLTLSAETVTNMTCNELRDLLAGLGGCKSGNHADLVYRVCRIKSTMALLMQGTHAVSDCGVLTQVDDSAGMGAHEPDASAGAKRARRIA